MPLWVTILLFNIVTCNCFNVDYLTDLLVMLIIVYSYVWYVSLVVSTMVIVYVSCLVYTCIEI